MSEPIIIIGTGLAGYQLAREFRKIDQTAPLTIITADQGNFYSKPQLSTALTSGKSAETLISSSAQAMAKQLNATIRTNTLVTHIDPVKKSILMSDEEIGYSKLVLACGADVLKAPLQGNAVNNVISINHLYHYAMFQDLIRHKKSVTILGAGLIGCEFANDLCNAGYEVNIIAPSKFPLDLLIPGEIGELLKTALANHGVRWFLESIATEVNKKDDRYEVLLSTGKKLTTDLVLSAIGLVPHTQLAKTANIKIQLGIVVNRYLETSVKEIFALGDCAEVEGHVLPYITPLLNCSRSLAKTLAGSNTPVDYPAMPVMVKTPIHPLAICPPPKGMGGNWLIESEDNNVRALFYNDHNELYGFVLTNDAVKERMVLAKQLPNYF